MYHNVLYQGGGISLPKGTCEIEVPMVYSVVGNTVADGDYHRAFVSSTLGMSVLGAFLLTVQDMSGKERCHFFWLSRSDITAIFVNLAHSVSTLFCDYHIFSSIY